MDKKFVLFVMSMFLVFFSCTQRAEEKQERINEDPDEVADIHTAENSLDYWGTYKGVLPSGSGEGIQTTLRLRKDNTYILQSVYLGKGDDQFEDKGNYTVEGNLLTLEYLKGDNQYYKIGENQLSKLDNDMQPITGSLAGNYILNKVD